MNKTPQEILGLIQWAEEEIGRKTSLLETERVLENQSKKHKDKQEAEALYKSVTIPDVIRPFVVIENTRDVEKYERYFNERILEFQIPGLAPIAMIFTEERTNDYLFKCWLIAGVSACEDWNEMNEKYMQFGFTWGRWESAEFRKEAELYDVLHKAKQVADQLPIRQLALDGEFERKQKQAAEREQKESDTKDELLGLFISIKNDPVAVQLLKAFVLIKNNLNLTSIHKPHGQRNHHAQQTKRVSRQPWQLHSQHLPPLEIMQTKFHCDHDHDQIPHAHFLFPHLPIAIAIADLRVEPPPSLAATEHTLP
jgi:hypothetical protein